MIRFFSFVQEYSSVPVYLSALWAILLFKRQRNEFRVISYFVFASAVCELISSIMWSNRVNNFPLLHIYVAVGFLILIWFYSMVLKGFISQKLMWATGILFLLFTTINSLFIQSIFSFNTHALVAEAILIIVLSVSTYILLLNEIVRARQGVSTGSINWINSGLFIYYASSLLIFYFGNYFTGFFSPEVNQIIWSMHTLFSTVMYICISVGLWKSSKN
jgi:hypothetical protein